MFSRTFRARSDSQDVTVNVDEQALIERCKNSVPDAFNELVAHFEKRIYNLAFRICGNADDASDVTQEAFIRVFNSIHAFRGDANFTTWVYRIVKNVYLDERKKSKSNRLTSLDDYIELDENSVSRQIQDQGPLPADIIEQKERAQIIQNAIDSLPEYQRIIVSLYHMQHQSYEEIAEILNLPIGTVKSRLNRARLSLSEVLKNQPELFQ